MKVEQDIRRVDSSEAMMKFDQIETRIDRMEADADLVNFGKKSTLEEKFDQLHADEEIESELAKLKANLNQSHNTSKEDSAP